MTIDKMIEIFDLMQDKSESDYFLDSEKVDFLNLSQEIFLREQVFPNGDDSIGIESKINALEKIESLIYPLTVSSDSEGLISRSSINGLLESTTGNSPETFFHLMDVSENDTSFDLRFVRHNDLHKHNRNDFKKPTTDYRVYTLTKDGIIVLPKEVRTYDIDVIKNPSELIYISQGNISNIDSEFPSLVHADIIGIALELAGVSTRDGAIIGIEQLKDET